MVTTWRLVLALVLSAVSVHGQCYDPSTDVAGVQTTCVDAAKAAATNTTLYWFGGGFSAECNSLPPTAISCFNPLGRTGYSIITLLYNDGPGYDPNLVDRYLGVTYTSPAGEYTGCDHHVVTHEQVFTIDGTEDLTYKPWTLRELPALTWDTDSDAFSQYLLLVIDVGYGFMHGVYSNIVGNDLSTATVIKQYAGPKNWRDVANPYAFLIFGQSTEDMVLSSAWQSTIAAVSSSNRLDLATFVSENGLTGPIAMNWVVANYDAYSIESMRHYVADNCAFLVSEALENSVASSLPFLPRSPHFSIFLHVEYTASPVSITYCCQDYTSSGGIVILDAIGATKLAASDLSSTPNTIELRETAIGTPSSASDFTGEMFTLLLVTPDMGAAPYGTSSHPFIQMMSINIDAGDFATADTVHAYWPPLPVTVLNFYFLLYRQSASVNITDTTSYSSGPANTLDSDRYMFDIIQFVSDFNLTLVAVNRMTVENDVYVNYKLEEYGSSFTECTVDECPDDVSDVTTVTSHVTTVSYNVGLIGLVLLTCLVH